MTTDLTWAMSLWKTQMTTDRNELVEGSGRKRGCLGYRGFFSPTFINPNFRFSSVVKCENLDYKKSEISKHPSFRYSPVVNIENLDFKNPRFLNIQQNIQLY